MVPHEHVYNKGATLLHHVLHNDIKTHTHAYFHCALSSSLQQDLTTNKLADS
jgi:hypothetical protein